MILIAAAIGIAGSAQAGTLCQSLPDLTVPPIDRGYCSTCNSFPPFRVCDRFTLGAGGVVDA